MVDARKHRSQPDLGRAHVLYVCRPKICTAVFCQMRGDDRLREVMTGKIKLKA
jgi:NADH:ubiquinone oxidoreductase subunit E